MGKPLKKATKGFLDEVVMAHEEGTKLLTEGYKTYDKHLFAELARRMNEVLGTDKSAGWTKSRYYHRPRKLLIRDPSDIEALDETTWAHAQTTLRAKGLMYAVSRDLGKKSRKKK